MSNCDATLNFDTEFRVPQDCLRSGEVTCKVVRQRCDLLACWDHWVTFRVVLRLKITIRSGELVETFHRTVILKESVWLEGSARVRDCAVTGAICRCVLHRGRIHCNGTVRVEFELDHCRPVSLIRPSCPPSSIFVLPIILPIPIPIPWPW